MNVYERIAIIGAVRKFLVFLKFLIIDFCRDKPMGAYNTSENQNAVFAYSVGAVNNSDTKSRIATFFLSFRSRFRQIREQIPNVYLGENTVLEQINLDEISILFFEVVFLLL